MVGALVAFMHLMALFVLELFSGSVYLMRIERGAFHYYSFLLLRALWDVIGVVINHLIFIPKPQSSIRTYTTSDCFSSQPKQQKMVGLECQHRKMK